MTGSRVVVLLPALTAAAIVLAASSPARAAGAPAANPIPVLAYYYIWYTPTSWQRAKSDLPLLGPYSSDQASVMRQHVIWAKGAGIDGFIVSWKSTPALNPRLARLVSIADAEHFKLGLIYESLDFRRHPLPPGLVATDLEQFATLYGRNPAFQVFGRKPLVIWSGTWKFTTAQVAAVTRQVRGRLQVLASAKNVAGYLRVAPYVDGDAYYWSSVDFKTPRYRSKLDAMSGAIHAHGGLWIAPAAAGYDGRLLGSNRVVPRRNGLTLGREYAAALSSSPDAVGLISWNEFSENSQIEPSRDYGSRYLQLVARMLGAPAPSIPDFDSDQPVSRGTSYGLPLLGAIIALCLVSAAFLVYRSRRRRPEPGSSRPRSPRA